MATEIASPPPFRRAVRHLGDAQRVVPALNTLNVWQAVDW
jgi:hypothetical protein